MENELYQQYFLQAQQQWIDMEDSLSDFA